MPIPEPEVVANNTVEEIIVEDVIEEVEEEVESNVGSTVSIVAVCLVAVIGIAICIICRRKSSEV